MGYSESVRNSLNDVVFNGGSYTPPTNFYVSLYVGDPLGAGVEVSGGGYARQLNNDWDASAAGVVDNTNVIDYGTTTASWGTPDYFGVHDALTGGNIVAYGNITSQTAIGSGVQVTFPAGDLDIALNDAD